MKRNNPDEIFRHRNIHDPTLSHRHLAGTGYPKRTDTIKSGATSATIEASIEGYETVDYILNIKAGQYINMSMALNNGANYFNIVTPSENNVVMFIGSTRGPPSRPSRPSTNCASKASVWSTSVVTTMS